VVLTDPVKIQTGLKVNSLRTIVIGTIFDNLTMFVACGANIGIGVNRSTTAVGTVNDLKILICVTHNKNLSKCSVLFVISAFYSIYFSDARKILGIFKYSFMPNEKKYFVTEWHSIL
tara:strand:- start:13 stop:363 length:351 start_codon:yes stop_codon:yes gene_type:complete